MREDSKIDWRTIILAVGASLIAAFATIYTAEGEYKVATVSADTDRIALIWEQLDKVQKQAEYDRLEYRKETQELREELHEVREQNEEQRIEIISLRYQLKEYKKKTEGDITSKSDHVLEFETKLFSFNKNQRKF